MGLLQLNIPWQEEGSIKVNFHSYEKKFGQGEKGIESII